MGLRVYSLPVCREVPRNAPTGPTSQDFANGCYRISLPPGQVVGPFGSVDAEAPHLGGIAPL